MRNLALQNQGSQTKQKNVGVCIIVSYKKKSQEKIVFENKKE